MSDNEEESNVEIHGNTNRSGEFAFNPLGPDSLNDIENEVKNGEAAEESKTTMILQGSLCATPEEEDAASLVPVSTLELLAGENISMKEDLELKLTQIIEYKYII